MSKYVGESEKLIKTLFDMARSESKRVNKPAIIFIDEIDSMLSARSDGENESSKRVKTEFLVQMQGVGHEEDRLLVLGATNLPWGLDSAVRRRFERRIYFPLPDVPAIEYLLGHSLKKIGKDCNIRQDEIQKMASKLVGYSGADISILIKDAVMEPLRVAQLATRFRAIKDPATGKTMYEPADDSASGPDIVVKSLYDLPNSSLQLPKLTIKDLEKSRIKKRPSVGPENLKQYLEWTTQFGQDG
jgi:vacuolar protein-sorting-associated protein 4